MFLFLDLCLLLKFIEGCCKGCMSLLFLGELGLDGGEGLLES